MLADDYAVVATFSMPYEAQIARASLQAAGIEALIADEHTINMDWFYSNALGGVRLLVPRAQLVEARELVAADFSDALPQAAEPVRCPACGSEDVVAEVKGRKSALVMILLLGFPLLFYRRGQRCRTCNTFFTDTTERHL